MTQLVQSTHGVLVDVFSDLFVLGNQVKYARDLGSPDSFRIRLEHLLHEADGKGVELGLTRDALLDARFGVVAFLDEMIFTSGWTHKDEWASRPLQYQFFETNIAGEEFFTRLESIRKALPVNPDLLEVYLVCLTLGFEGQYKIHGRERLKDLRHDVFREIHAKRGDPAPLSPHGQRHEEIIDVVKRDLPAWIVAVGAVSIVFFFYVSLSVLIHQESVSVADRLQTLMVQTNP